MRREEGGGGSGGCAEGEETAADDEEYTLGRAPPLVLVESLLRKCVKENGLSKLLGTESLLPPTQNRT